MHQIEIESTGDILNVPEGMSDEEAVDKYYRAYLKREGVKHRDEHDIVGKGQEAFDHATDMYTKGNPLSSAVASYQAGAKNLGRNLLQMALPEEFEEMAGVSDNDIKRHQRNEERLKDRHGAMHMAGEIVPTLATGAVGKGATSLPRAMAEGAAYGGALAGPEERGQGMTTGAVLSGAMNRIGRTASRMGKGAVPISDNARKVMQTARQTPGGEEVFLPLSKAAPTTGKGGGGRYVYDTILSNFPGSSRPLDGQVGQSIQTTYRNMLRQAYGKHADDVIAKLNETGSVLKAAQHGEDLAKANKIVGHDKLRRVILEASELAPQGNPSMRDISRMSGRIYGGQGMRTLPFKDMADDLDVVLTSGVKDEKSLAFRSMFYSIVNWGGLLIPSVAARAAASKPIQKALSGETALQRQFTEAIKKKQSQRATQIAGQILRELGIQDVQE